MFLFQRIVLPCVLGVLTACLPMAVQADNPSFQEAISPDNSMVAYVNAEDGDSEIYVERADGTERRRLTNNDCYDNDPSWSPDGKHIAFASDRSGNWQIHRMDSNGDNVVQLTKLETGCVQPKYGPQGQLAYLIRRGRKVKRELFDLVVSAGEELQRLEQGIPIHSIAWHPDGELIGCATDGRFMLHNLRDGTKRLVELKDTDERLSFVSGGWSNPVVDKEGFGVQGRLVICEKLVGDDRREVVVYVELRDATSIIGRPMRLYCDMGKTDFRRENLSGLHCELKDSGNRDVESAAFAFSGAVPLSQWITLPCDATIRLRASPFGIHRPQGMAISPHLGSVWVIGDDDSNEYFLSGTFAIIPRENGVSPSEKHVWTGTIDLPPIRIVNKPRASN